VKRSPTKRGLAKPVQPRKTAASVRGKTAAVTERASGETRAKTKVRLDIALVERGLLEARETAARVILAGDVMVDGQRWTRRARWWRPARGSSWRRARAS
jgi:ribosomal protein S4